MAFWWFLNASGCFSVLSLKSKTTHNSAFGETPSFALFEPDWLSAAARHQHFWMPSKESFLQYQQQTMKYNMSHWMLSYTLATLAKRSFVQGWSPPIPSIALPPAPSLKKQVTAIKKRQSTFCFLSPRSWFCPAGPGPRLKLHLQKGIQWVALAEFVVFQPYASSCKVAMSALSHHRRRGDGQNCELFQNGVSKGFHPQWKNKPWAKNKQNKGSAQKGQSGECFRGWDDTMDRTTTTNHSILTSLTTTSSNPLCPYFF